MKFYLDSFYCFIFTTFVARIVCVVSPKFDDDSIQSYEFISPIQYGETRATYVSTRINQTEHVENTTLEFSAFQRTFRVHLFKNNILLPPSFRIRYQSSNDVIHRNDVENCYYQGYLGDDEHSTVAFSTCDGLHGVIRDGNGDEFHVKPFPWEEEVDYFLPNNSHNPNSGDYIIYKSKKNVTRDYTCGLNHTKDNNKWTHRHTKPAFSNGSAEGREYKKIDIYGKKYIEIIVVMDHREYKRYKRSRAETTKAGLSIMNSADTIYKQINTRMALRELIVWDYNDKITVTENSDKLLDNFKAYTKQELFGKLGIKADAALLLTGIDLEGTVVGLAGIGVMCSKGSASIVEDHSPGNPGPVGITVAHEVGHTLGFNHNEADNDCTCSKCVMDSITRSWPVIWSPCSTNTYYKSLSNGHLSCLFNYPAKLYGGPKCGNGFLEKGEQCDCGSEQECQTNRGDRCCDPKTCKLQTSAKCATGPCCKDCQPQDVGYLCREADEQCDLTEYCTGDSVTCPSNTYKQDGTPCDSGNGFCHRGVCKSPDLQCQTFFGSDAVRGHDLCFDANTHGDKYANCGLNNKIPIPCPAKDKYCGKLQCMSRSVSVDIPAFPSVTGSKRGTTYRKGKPPYCKMSFITSLADGQQPPLLAAMGTKCGKTAICDNRVCRNLSTYKDIIPCKVGCRNGGVCNNKGNCHCTVGYACPTCENAGFGGSFDSGQGCTEQETCCMTETTKLEIVIILFILIIGGLVAYIVFIKQHTIKNIWYDYINKGKQARGEAVNQKRPQKHRDGAEKHHGSADKHHGNGGDQSTNGKVLSYNNQDKGTVKTSGNKNPVKTKSKQSKPVAEVRMKDNKPAVISSTNATLEKSRQTNEDPENKKSINIFSKAKNLVQKPKSSQPSKDIENKDVISNPGASSKIVSFNKMDKEAKAGDKIKPSPSPRAPSKANHDRDRDRERERERDRDRDRDRDKKQKDQKLDMSKVPSNSQLTKVENSPPKYKDVAYNRAKELGIPKSPAQQTTKIHIYNNEELPMNRRTSLQPTAPAAHNKQGDIVLGNTPAINEHSPRHGKHHNSNVASSNRRYNAPPPSPKPGILSQVEAYNVKDKEAGNDGRKMAPSPQIKRR